MKAKPFKAAPVPSLTCKGPFDTLTRAEVVALIASRVPRKREDDDRAVRGRVSSKVNYDVGKRKLRRQASGRFRLGDIGLWARTAWPEARFHDLPMIPISGGATLALPALRGTANGYSPPKTLQAATREILDLRGEATALKRALAAASAQVKELEADALKWRDWIRKKRGKRQR